MPLSGARAVPVDTTKADEHPVNTADYDKADLRGKELRARILSSAEARAAYQQAVSDI